MAEELTSNGFNEFIKEGFVLVDFYAEWCMPCLMMSPIVDEISEKMKDKVKVGKLNIDEGQEIAQKYGISSIPNFILFKDGEKIEQFTGSMTGEELEENINSHLKE